MPKESLQTIRNGVKRHYNSSVRLSRHRVRRLIVHENPTQRATKNFTIAWALTAFKSHWYRYIMFIPAFRPTTSVITSEAQLRENLRHNYSKWRRFCTPPKQNLGLSSQQKSSLGFRSPNVQLLGYQILLTALLHPKRLVNFPRTPFPETIKLTIRGFFGASKNSCRTFNYEVKCPKASWFQAREAFMVLLQTDAVKRIEDFPA